MNKLEELENKIKELVSEIERLKEEKKNEVWEPKDGEEYWFIYHTGAELSTSWHSDAVDEKRYKIGNVFKTEEEARFRVEQLKVEAELRRFGRKFVPNSRNYCLRYDHESKVMYIEYFSSIQDGGIYFYTEDIARRAIDTVGEDRIKKYYFGIKVN